MESILGPSVKIVDPSKELAYEVGLVLEKCRLKPVLHMRTGS